MRKGSLAGYFFMIILGALAFTWLGWSGFAGAIVGSVLWFLLLIWRNFGGGNPILNKIADLKYQNKLAKDDIDELRRRKIRVRRERDGDTYAEELEGYREEVRYLETFVRENEREIQELEDSLDV